MPEARSDVVPLRLEPVERRELGGSPEQRLGVDGETHVVLGVRAAHGRGIRILLEPGSRDLPDRHQHREERHAGGVALSQEAAVDELEDRVQHVGGPRRTGRDRLDGRKAEVAREHAEAHEQGPCARGRAGRRSTPRSRGWCAGARARPVRRSPVGEARGRVVPAWPTA